jgi:molybdopterin-guanine dinucleotide biosynthesis protein B
MGYRVGVLKHAGEIDLPDSDTAKYREQVPIVSAVAPTESEIIIKGERTLGEMLKYFESDIVLIEGFKREKTFPKIVCLRDENEKKELFDGLELFTASFHKDISDFDILNDDHVMKMAAVAFERGFKLPELDCAHCGYETCYELAREIVQGHESTEQCVSLTPPISVKIDGDSFPLNHYTSNLFKNTIMAMVSSLKGYKKGTIQIEIP